MEKRVIKFRAWDNRNRRMGYFGAGFSHNDEYNIWHLQHDSGLQVSDVPCEDNIDLMQFTGIKDNSGKEIYEGDIIHYLFSFDNEKLKKKAKRHKGFVVWCTEHAAFEIAHKLEAKHGLVFNSGDFCACELIGNIYQNPELSKS